jgi:hypothetical protein
LLSSKFAQINVIGPFYGSRESKKENL